MVFLFMVLLLNVGISFWNARSAGKVWAEAKGLGGWIQIVVWCSAIQSALGFTYVYVAILVILANTFHILSGGAVECMTELAYLFLVIPLLGTGLIMTIHSWITAAREKSLLSMGVAGWNTFAQAYNTYHAIQEIGPAFAVVHEHLGNFFSRDNDSDRDSDEDSIVLLLAAAAVLGGIITTMTIMQLYMGSLPVSEQIRRHYAGLNRT